MWHTWERREKCTKFWWESPKERDHLEDWGVDGMKMDLREVCWGRGSGGVDSPGSG
jgi:alpha-glucosidase (family GH31 glycosyl hydrolase)